MKKTLMTIFIINILLIVISSQTFALDNRKNVLVINSYSTEYSWTADIVRGIKDTFLEYDDQIKIKTEYMDTKNNNTEEYKENLYRVYKNKYKNEDLDAIIVSDDNGLLFMLKYGNELFPDVPIFFCGINSLSKYKDIDLSQLSGVIEKPSVRETMDIILRANQNINKIYLVTESTLSGEFTTDEVIRELSNYEDIEVEILIEDTLQDMSSRIGSINDDKGVVLITFYAVDQKGNVYDSNKHTYSKLVSSSQIPVYSLWDFGFGYGVIGGKLVSGYDQGVEVSKLYLEYFKSGEYTPSIVENINKHMYDYSAMVKFGVDTKTIPEGSYVINIPRSFFNEHKIVILWSSLIIIVLIIYIYLLQIQIRKGVKREKKILEDLMKSEKLNSLVVLVKRLSHEMNTPLGNIITSLSYIMKTDREISEKASRGTLTSKEFSKMMDKYKDTHSLMDKDIKKAIKIVNSFKGISSNHTVEDSKFNLKSKLERIVLLMNDKISSNTCNISVEIDCPESIEIKIKAGYLFQVFSHLIDNSISHGFEDRENGKIYIRAWEDDEKIYIKYSDDGNGTNDMCSKVFDPFYTRKKWHDHQGLGLFTVHNIINSVGGSITCSGQEGGGLVFDIVLAKK